MHLFTGATGRITRTNNDQDQTDDDDYDDDVDDYVVDDDSDINLIQS